MILKEYNAKAIFCPMCSYDEAAAVEYFDGENTSCPVCGFFKDIPSQGSNNIPSQFRIDFSKSILWFVYLLRETINFDITDFEKATKIKSEKIFIDKCIEFIDKTEDYEIPVRYIIIRELFE